MKTRIRKALAAVEQAKEKLFRLDSEAQTNGCSSAQWEEAKRNLNTRVEQLAQLAS